MKTAGTLRKKGLGGVDHFMKKDKAKGSPSSSPSPASSSVSTPRVTATPPMARPVQQAPITVDLHRFADDNLQPEECKFTEKKPTEYLIKLFLFKSYVVHWEIQTKKASEVFTSLYLMQNM